MFVRCPLASERRLSPSQLLIYSCKNSRRQAIGTFAFVTKNCNLKFDHGVRQELPYKIITLATIEKVLVLGKERMVITAAHLR